MQLDNKLACYLFIWQHTDIVGRGQRESIFLYPVNFFATNGISLLVYTVPNFLLDIPDSLLLISLIPVL